MASSAVTIDLGEHRLRRHLPTGRTLHLVDLENLAGGSSASPADVDGAISSYERIAPFGVHDHRVVACGKGLVFPVGDRWPGALVRYARGIDGADRLLLAAADPVDVAARFDRVVVASGDGGGIAAAGVSSTGPAGSGASAGAATAGAIQVAAA